MNNRRHYTLPEASIPSPHVQLIYDGCREVTSPRGRFSHLKFQKRATPKDTLIGKRVVKLVLVMKIPIDSFPWPGSTASEKISGNYFW